MYYQEIYAHTQALDPEGKNPSIIGILIDTA